MSIFDKLFGRKSAASSMPAPAPQGGQIVLHLRRDASILALQELPSGYAWRHVTLDLLQKELAAVRDQGVAIIYSRDDPEAAPSKEVELVFKIIMSFKMPIQLRPTPPVPIPA